MHYCDIKPYAILGLCYDCCMLSYVTNIITHCFTYGLIMCVVHQWTDAFDTIIGILFISEKLYEIIRSEIRFIMKISPQSNIYVGALLTDYLIWCEQFLDLCTNYLLH